MNKIGFIGQGWIGRNYADEFEERGFEVVRYSKEVTSTRDEIGTCDLVFIAVPTPTTPNGFDDSIIREVIPLVKTVAVIKSTIIPGTTESIQKENLDIVVMHAPEFLTEATAQYDVRNPIHNIIGITTEEHRSVAERVMSILPKSSSNLICSAKEAEIYKYLQNSFLYTKNVYMNILYDLVTSYGLEWDNIQSLLQRDEWVGSLHTSPVHKSGRGAGGHCLPKDFAALTSLIKERCDGKSIEVFKAIEDKNTQLLKESNKDIDILEGIYG